VTDQGGLLWILLLLLLLLVLVQPLKLEFSHCCSFYSLLVVYFVWTVFAFAGCSTSHPGVKTLTVSLLTVRFLTVATLFRQATVSKSAVLNANLGCSDFSLKEACVLTGCAGTIFPAHFPRAKTFTIHLQTESLLTVTAYFLLFAGIGDCLHVRDMFSERIFPFALFRTPLLLRRL